MKKLSIIFSVVSLIFFGSAYYFMQKSSTLISESEQAVLDIKKILHSPKKEISNKHVYPDKEGLYYYEDMNLKQADHIIINNCMQYYINDKSFNNANKCEQLIVDALIKNMGETAFVKAILGNMINYKDEVTINNNFPKLLFDTGITEAPLKSKLILTFINRYRDPIKLQAVFDNYKDYFFASISKNLYEKLFKNYLNTFIDSFDEIEKKKDKDAFFKSIYYEAETKNRHDEFWKITFWKRRELEKNSQIIYAILKEIKTYYEHK